MLSTHPHKVCKLVLPPLSCFGHKCCWLYNMFYIQLFQLQECPHIPNYTECYKCLTSSTICCSSKILQQVCLQIIATTTVKNDIVNPLQKHNYLYPPLPASITILALFGRLKHLSCNGFTLFYLINPILWIIDYFMCINLLDASQQAIQGHQIGGL